MAEKNSVENVCFIKNGVNGKCLFFIENGREVELAKGITRCYTSGSYTFFERLAPENYGWSVVEKGEKTISHLGRLIDDYYFRVDTLSYYVSFFDVNRRIRTKACQNFYAVQLNDQGRMYETTMVLEKESGKCVVYRRVRKGDNFYAEPYQLKKGEIFVVPDKDGKDIAFVATFENKFGQVTKLGQAKKRWKIMAQEGIAFYRSWWEVLLGRYKF